MKSWFYYSFWGAGIAFVLIMAIAVFIASTRPPKVRGMDAGEIQRLRAKLNKEYHGSTDLDATLLPPR